MLLLMKVLHFVGIRFQNMYNLFYLSLKFNTSIYRKTGFRTKTRDIEFLTKCRNGDNLPARSKVVSGNIFAEISLIKRNC